MGIDTGESYRVGWLQARTAQANVSVAAAADFTNAYRLSLETQPDESPGRVPGPDSLRARAGLRRCQDRGPRRSQEVTVAVWLVGVSCSCC
jgi:hypothetical protein